MDLADLEGKHKGETLYVLGSGSTLNHYDASFFQDKTCVFTSIVGYTLNLDQGYAFSHHWRKQKPAILGTENMIHVVNAKEYPSLEPYEGHLSERVILHTPKSWTNSHSQFNPFEQDKPGEHQLVFASSSAHGALHLAAYLGARWIVLVGVDCGIFDGETNMKNHGKQTQHSFATWNQHWSLMKRWVKETYGADTYSMLPFTTPNMDGHKYEGPAGRLNA